MPTMKSPVTGGWYIPLNEHFPFLIQVLRSKILMTKDLHLAGSLCPMKLKDFPGVYQAGATCFVHSLPKMSSPDMWVV